MNQTRSEPPASVSEHRSPKRARVTEQSYYYYYDLPVVGLHLALVGPSHITRLFASSLTRQITPQRSEWDLQDRIAIQELERRSRQRIRPTERKYVHLYEKLNHKSLPNPCHIVHVVVCDPRSFISYHHHHHHPNIQQALQESRQHYDPSNVSILLCFDSNAPTMYMDSSALPVFPYEPPIFTCWHPQLESSRQEVVQSLWKRCRLSHRMMGTSPWLYIQNSLQKNNRNA